MKVQHPLCWWQRSLTCHTIRTTASATLGAGFYLTWWPSRTHIQTHPAALCSWLQGPYLSCSMYAPIQPASIGVAPVSFELGFCSDGPPGLFLAAYTCFFVGLLSVSAVWRVSRRVLGNDSCSVPLWCLCGGVSSVTGERRCVQDCHSVGGARISTPDLEMMPLH